MNTMEKSEEENYWDIWLTLYSAMGITTTKGSWTNSVEDDLISNIFHT